MQQQRLLLLQLLLQLLLLLRCSAAGGPPPSPWELPIPSDAELLAAAAPSIELPLLHENMLHWGAPYRSLRFLKGYRGPPKLSRVNLFIYCIQDFTQTHQLVEHLLSPPILQTPIHTQETHKGAPQGAPQGPPQGAPNRAPLGGPQGAPQRGPQMAPLRGPQGAPQRGPQMAPLRGPQGAPKEAAQGDTQGAPMGGPLGAPLGDAEWAIKELSSSFELVRKLMKEGDIIQEVVVARALLQMKRKAEEEEVSPRAVSFMLPLLLQWWGWFKQQKETDKYPMRAPPIQVYRQGPPICSRLKQYLNPWACFAVSCLLPQLSFKDFLTTLLPMGDTQQQQQQQQQKQQQQQEQRRSGDTLLLRRCTPVSFVWAQLMGAAAATRGPLEVYLREESRKISQRIISEAKEATQLEILQSRMQAAAAAAASAAAAAAADAAAAAAERSGASAAATAAAVSPLLLSAKKTEKEEGEAPLSAAELQQQVAAAVMKRQTAIKEAKDIAEETDKIERRRMLLMHANPTDVCLASLAAIKSKNNKKRINYNKQQIINNIKQRRH